MVEKQQLYVAKLVGWLNFRYYVIELHNRFYIIDYANPRDIRNYFPGFFPKHNRQYTIYDITDTRDQYIIKSLPWWQRSGHQLIESWAAAIWIIVGIVLLHSLGIYFVHNDDILPFWKFLLLLHIITISTIIFSLNRTSETPSQLFTEKSYKIERKPQLRYISKRKKVRTGPVAEAMQILIGLPIGFIFTLNRDYMIMLFGFIGFYNIFFIRFLNLFDILSMNKFVFLKEEG